MRRICSSLILFLCELICAFTALWFLRISITLWTIWGLSLAGVYPAPYRRKKKSEKNQDQVYLRFRKSVKKIKSVASVLSVSHFERMRTEPQGEGALQCGTVFQTAYLCLFIIPRLRPGLLSHCSVLSSRQLLLCSLAMFKINHG